MHYSAPARTAHTSLQGNSSASRIRDESPGGLRGGGELGALRRLFPFALPFSLALCLPDKPHHPPASLSLGLSGWLSLTCLSPHALQLPLPVLAPSLRPPLLSGSLLPILSFHALSFLLSPPPSFRPLSLLPLPSLTLQVSVQPPPPPESPP